MNICADQPQPQTDEHFLKGTHKFNRSHIYIFIETVMCVPFSLQNKLTLMSLFPFLKLQQMWLMGQSSELRTEAPSLSLPVL